MISGVIVRRGKTFSFAACLTLLMMLSAYPSCALDPSRKLTQYVQSSLNSEMGLPQNSVHAISQTKDGFLWFATEEGLARYDGVQVTVFSHRKYPGITSDYMRALLTAQDGSLWIGTDSGLTHLQNLTSAAGHVPSGEFRTITTKDGLSDDTITRLAQDHQGTIWIGTARGLSWIRGGQTEHWPGKDSLATSSIRALVVDAQGTVWAGTDEALFRIQGGQLTQWTHREGLPEGEITALAASRDGSLWVGMLSGKLAVVRNDRIATVQLRLPGYEVHALLEDRDGALWISFDRHGIGRLYQNKLETYDASGGLPSNRCTQAIFQDREGSLWIGLLDSGVVQLREGKFAVYGKPEGLLGNYVGNVLQARDGSMWIGSDSNGLNRLLPDGRVEVWDKRRGLPDDAIYCLVQRRDGSLWIGFRHGALARIANGKVSVFHDASVSESSLNSIFEDREGRLWVGFFGKGIAQFDGRNFHHVTQTGRVVSIAESPDGALWFALDGNGVRRDFRNKVTLFTAANGLPNDHAMCVYAEPNGDLWVGTSGGGLSRIRNDHVVSWTPDSGLPDSSVGSIIADNQGSLWLGTDSGILRISTKELASSAESSPRVLHPVLYGSSDGLRARETVYEGMPACWKDSQGRLWFATIMGAAVVDPTHIPVNDIPPTAWIERLSIDSRVVPPQDGIRLGPSAGNLEVMYTGVSFAAPQNVRFRYRLIGFDREWVSAGTRRVAWYTNLPPGRYRFVVQAENSDGVWSAREASFSFVLKPPLSRSPTAYVLYSLIGLLLGWAVTALRTRSLMQRQQELSRVVAIRTAQLEKEKAALEATRRELDFRATHDSLTGLLNRAAVLERLKEELARSVREQTPLTVIIADLDHFKSINDNFGHLCGDDVIREAAQRFRSALREYDVVGRYGGEEFLILLPNWDASQSPERIDALLDTLRSRPFEMEERALHVTSSMGVARFCPGMEQPDMRALLSRADTALYVAKNQGRNQASYEVRVLD